MATRETRCIGQRTGSLRRTFVGEVAIKAEETNTLRLPHKADCLYSSSCLEGVRLLKNPSTLTSDPLLSPKSTIFGTSEPDLSPSMGLQPTFSTRCCLLGSLVNQRADLTSVSGLRLNQLGKARLRWLGPSRTICRDLIAPARSRSLTHTLAIVTTSVRTVRATPKPGSVRHRSGSGRSRTSHQERLPFGAPRR